MCSLFLHVSSLETYFLLVRFGVVAKVWESTHMLSDALGACVAAFTGVVCKGLSGTLRGPSIVS